MPLAPKLLQASTFTGTTITVPILYKVGTTRDPNATGAVVANIRLQNTGALGTVIYVFCRGANASLPLVSFVKNYTLNPGDFILLRIEISLEKDALVGMQATVTADQAISITCVICGAEIL